MNIHLLCFIHYNLGYFGRVGKRNVVYSSMVIYPLHLCIPCDKWNCQDNPPGSLPWVPSLFHIRNGFTVKHRRSVRLVCQCDTNCVWHFTLDAHASRPVAWLPCGHTNYRWAIAKSYVVLCLLNSAVLCVKFKLCRKVSWNTLTPLCIHNGCVAL